MIISPPRTLLSIDETTFILFIVSIRERKQTIVLRPGNDGWYLLSHRDFYSLQPRTGFFVVVTWKVLPSLPFTLAHNTQPVRKRRPNTFLFLYHYYISCVYCHIPTDQKKKTCSNNAQIVSLLRATELWVCVFSSRSHWVILLFLIQKKKIEIQSIFFFSQKRPCACAPCGAIKYWNTQRTVHTHIFFILNKRLF